MTDDRRRLYYKQNRLKQLRAFCFAAQSGSISRAAESMFLSQPSISLLIKALEKDLKEPLFERKGPKIKLTKEGSILLDLALPLVEGLESLPEALSERCNNTVSGELNIAAGESTIMYILPKIIKQFKTAFPQIRVQLNNVTGRDGLTMLRAGEVDFAVGSMLNVPDDIIYIPTLTYDPVLITPLDHALAGKVDVTIEDIGPYGLILPPRHLSTWRMVQLVFQQHRVDFKVALEAGGWEVIKKYVEMGLGVSIVTSICLSEDDNLASIPLNKYFPQRNYGIVVRRGKILTPAARGFFELVNRQLLEKFYALTDKNSVDVA